MKVSAILSLAALVGSSLAVAIPNGGEDYSCYKCEYRQDDCGNKYGGSYDSCSYEFEKYFPKPYCPPKECYSCSYKKDDCGYEYGGSYNHCEGDFDYHYKKPKCKGHKKEHGKKHKEKGEDGKEYEYEYEYDD